MFRLEITEKARRQLDRLHGQIRTRIQSAIQQLAANPRPPGSLKMADMKNAWRIRVGEYRIIYEIHDDVLVIVIVRVGHRRDVYR